MYSYVKVCFFICEISLEQSYEQFYREYMTKFIRQRHKHHEPIDSIAPIVDQNQCLTQVSIRQKNISRLVFVESDDDQQSPNTKKESFNELRCTLQPRANQDHIPICRRSLSRDRGGSTMLRPSIMQSNLDNEEQYENVISYESNKIPNSARLVGKRNSVRATVNGFLEAETKIKEDTIQQEHHRRRRAFDQLLLEQQEKMKREEKKTEKQQQESIVIPSLQATTLCFQQSDDEAQKGSQTKEEGSDKAATSNKLDSNQQKCQSNSYSQKETFLEDYTRRQIDLTDAKSKIQQQQKSKYIEQLLTSHPTFQQLSTIALAPILPDTKQIFQVHVYSTLTQKQYFFWLNMNTEMRLFMKAKKQLHPLRTEFQITVYKEDSTTYLDICKLVSNFDRSRFNILKYDGWTMKEKLLGTFCSSVSLNNHKTVVMYFPKVDEHTGEVQTLYKLANDLDLQQIYRENVVKNIDYSLTTHINLGKKLQIMSHYEHRTSKKSMQFKNSKGKVNLIIGKKASKRYHIIAGAGLTPVQIFSMVIVQIET